MFSKPVVFQTWNQHCKMHEKIYLNISLSWPNMWVTKANMSSANDINTTGNTCHMFICDTIYRQMKWCGPCYMIWLLKTKHDKKYDAYDTSFKWECKLGKNMWCV